MNTKQRFNDLKGIKCGKLTVVSFSHINKHRVAMWNCKCDCGNTCIVNGCGLRNGTSTACGCVKHELDLIRRKTHGQTANGAVSRTYMSWSAVKSRCLNPKNKGYANYGARGISICERWLESFDNFLEDMGERPHGKTLDRFPDMNGNYEPTNCRWATPKQQGENTRSCRILTYNDMTMNLSDWARYFKTCNSNLLRHLQKGRTIEQMVRFYEYKKHNNIRSKPFLFD